MTADIKTIVVLIALPEELAEFQKIFTVTGDLSTGNQVRLEHESGRENIRLISALSEQMGAQNALFSADDAIRDFSPNLVVVLGIAGGISSDLRIGDVCVSNEVIDVLHNSKVSSSDGKDDITFAPDFYSVDAELVASFTFLMVHPGYSNLHTTWRSEGAVAPDAVALADQVRADGPELLVGPIACGPVVASDQFADKLKSLHRKVTAVETESGGVFGRLIRTQVPAIAIRGISDLADADKAELEKRSKGGARRLAMANASRLLQQQIQNDRFVNVAIRHAQGQATDDELFPREEAKGSIIADLDCEIRARLAERSPEFKAKPDSFYLPIPRAQKISYADELAGKELEAPENLVECLQQEQRVLIRLPRSYPSQALGWSLAHSLIRQQIDQRVVLPYVLTGEALNPPRNGLAANLPTSFTATATRSEFVRVVIIEEPLFHARNRMKFLSGELNDLDAFIIVLTKAEDSVAAVDDFVKENGFKEYELAPVSFSETAFFLEKAFDMTAREAEAVAIRLDDTFRKFRLDAHPTYFAGIQEETIAALINANKRAELIQLAVDALLSLMVAADKTVPPLSRTTRERFLRRLVIEMARTKQALDDQALLQLATDFLTDGLLPTPAPDFLSPFFDIGLLYRMDGHIHVTHPYLESYLLAQALREDAEFAAEYFDPAKTHFNYYAFDLYCELGPCSAVIAAVHAYGSKSVDEAIARYPGLHSYLDNNQKLTALSSRRQLVSLSGSLMEAAEKMEKDDSSEAEVRGEKQRILDTRRYVRRQVGQRNPARQDDLPDEISTEFAILDNLSRSLTMSAVAVGSGAESLSGEEKVALGNLVLAIADKFSDIWTRNRLRVDFSSMRADILSDENIWSVIEEHDLNEDEFEKVKSDLSMFIHGFELNTMLEPMGRVLSNISGAAGVRVLGPVLERTSANNPVQSVIRSTWMLDVDAERGRDLLKQSLADYRGSPLMRIVLASHFLWRAFWHHYKTAGARHFVNSARRALRPLSLAPNPKQIESARRGPNRQD